MKKIPVILSAIILLVVVAVSCSKSDPVSNNTTVDPYLAIKAAFGNNINPDNLQNYAAQAIPNYITRDNTRPTPTPSPPTH